MKELNAESQKHNQENVEWLQSEAPALVDLKDEESPVKKEMESEILVESKTLNLSTPKATKSSIKTSHDNSSAKSVRIALPEEVNQSTPTGVTYNLRKMQLKSPFNHRRMPLQNPVATSTPKI